MCAGSGKCACASASACAFSGVGSAGGQRRVAAGRGEGCGERGSVPVGRMGLRVRAACRFAALAKAWIVGRHMPGLCAVGAHTPSTKDESGRAAGRVMARVARLGVGMFCTRREDICRRTWHVFFTCI